MIPPQRVVIAGPNGAGKSTCAPYLLPAGVPYIDADDIAKRLTGDVNKDITASRLMLAEWDRLAAAREDFAIETTLASRTLAARIGRLKSEGYEFDLVFYWLPSAEMAVERVAERVRTGGHNVPTATIRRRYTTGLDNFFKIYQRRADKWQMLDSRMAGLPSVVASGTTGQPDQVYNVELWDEIIEAHR